MGPVQGVQGADGSRICGGAQDDSAWASGRGATELENLVHVGRAVDVSRGLPDQWRPAELLGGGMPRPSGDEDCNAGQFPTPACPGHHGHSGGGKPPPPTVPPMQHAGPPLGTERKVTCHRSVRQGSEAKEVASSGGGAEVDLRDGLRGIRGAAGKCDGV